MGLWFRNGTHRTALRCFLARGLTPSNNRAREPAVTAREESAPEESAPEESAPEESAPGESAPEESAPEESPVRAHAPCFPNRRPPLHGKFPAPEAACTRSRMRLIRSGEGPAAAPRQACRRPETRSAMPSRPR